MERGHVAGRWARALDLVEAAEAHAQERHWALMPPELARRLRARVARVGDALLTLLPGSDALRLNRVTGLGHLGRANEATIDEIIAFYRAARLRRFSLMLGPGPQAEQIARWLGARGFERRRGHAVLMRDGREPVPRVTADVRVARARRDQADVIVAIQATCFAIPASRRSWSLAAARAPHVQHYLAYAGTRPVAVGALRIDGELAWLGGAGTLTRWRRRGAHAALIAVRLRSAARRGCRWAWVETAPPVPGRPQGSWRNLIRLGFEPVCMRPLFVWHGR